VHALAPAEEVSDRVRREVCFGDIAERRPMLRSAPPGLPRTGRDENDRKGRRPLGDLSREIEPLSSPRSIVDERDVRPELLSSFESLAPVEATPTIRDSLALQELACGLEKARTVVHG